MNYRKDELEKAKAEAKYLAEATMNYLMTGDARLSWREVSFIPDEERKNNE